jgi:hypothetical protein
MEHTDTLLTLAEVATAFAGFAALISVFRKRRESTLRQDAFRFRGVLENCLSVLAFSLLPLVVNSYGFQEDVSWRISSVVLLVIYGAIYIDAFRRLRQLLGSSWLRDWPFSLVTGFVLGILFFSVTLLSSFSITPQLGPALYLTALCCPLVIAGMLFMHFVLFSVEFDLET